MRALSEIQISRQALLSNAASLAQITPARSRRAVVVKGNAYGHGLKEVVEILEDQADYFQVDDIEELRELRKWTSRPALVLGYMPLKSIEEALSLNGELAIYDIERLDAIATAGKKLGLTPRVHLKIDALLGRQGVLPRDLPRVIEELQNHPEIELATAYTHFANIEDTTDLTHAQTQSDTFDKCHATLRESGWKDLGRHESATSGVMVHERPDSINDLVRLGVGVYGLYPSSALERSHTELRLQPVMRWVSHLAQVKTLPPRHPVGYGLTFITSTETRIGIVPQGYSDGYDRGLSNSGQVLVGGQRCSVLGRVAMNMFAIDLSRVPDAKPEDEVVLLGPQGSDCITAEELALRTGTINYEIVTRVAPFLPRVVV